MVFIILMPFSNQMLDVMISITLTYPDSNANLKTSLSLLPIRFPNVPRTPIRTNPQTSNYGAGRVGNNITKKRGGHYK